jgi:hypothetical protein
MQPSKHQHKYPLRRIHRASKNIQNDNFVNGILKGVSLNIFEEVKKYKARQGWG